MNIFDKSTYLRLSANEEFKQWQELFDLYLESLVKMDASILKPKVERNLIEKVDKSFRDLK